jgi:plastocyanin
VKSRFFALLGIAVVVVSGGVFLTLHSANGGGPGAVLIGNDTSVTHEYTISPGTFAALKRGDAVAVMPDVLQLHVGDSIRIRNDDDQSGVVGPFYVDAHSVMTQKFTSRGTYTGLCTVHPSGKITITVS